MKIKHKENERRKRSCERACLASEEECIVHSAYSFTLRIRRQNQMCTHEWWTEWIFLQNKETHSSMANHISVSRSTIDWGVPGPASPPTADLSPHPLSSLTEGLVGVPRANDSSQQLDSQRQLSGIFSQLLFSEFRWEKIHFVKWWW